MSLATRSVLSDAYPVAPTWGAKIGWVEAKDLYKKAPAQLYKESVWGLTLYLGAIKALFNLI